MIQPVSTLQRHVTLRSMPRSTTCLCLGERAFSVAAPLLGLLNSLPAETRNTATLETFKKKLKTFMFYKHFYDWLSFLNFYLLRSWSALCCKLLLCVIIIIIIIRTPRQNTCEATSNQPTISHASKFHHDVWLLTKDLNVTDRRRFSSSRLLQLSRYLIESRGTTNV